MIIHKKVSDFLYKYTPFHKEAMGLIEAQIIGGLLKFPRNRNQLTPVNQPESTE